jgi:hypothetical protein
MMRGKKSNPWITFKTLVTVQQLIIKNPSNKLFLEIELIMRVSCHFRRPSRVEIGVEY